MNATIATETAEYIRGVTVACEWLENYKLTEEEEKDGVAWRRDCPQVFAWLIRTKLLHPAANDQSLPQGGAKKGNDEH